jgi:hypothetical protein
MAQIDKNQIGFNDFSDFIKDSSHLMPKKVNNSLTSLNDASLHYAGGLA